MRVEFLPEKALGVGKAPIIADIRIGFEVAMAREGTYVPRMLNRIMEALTSLLKREKPKRLVIDGDLKHSFASFRRERMELETFLTGIREHVDEVILVRRNHDVGVLWLSELGVEIVDSLNLAGWTVVHGHRLEGGEVHNWVRTPSNKAGG